MRTTLGSLMQTALEQVGVVREVVERGAQQQKQRLDTVKLDRRRRDALAGLGEAIYRLAVSGRLGALADDPDIRAQLEEIDDVDQRIEAAEQRGQTGFAASAGIPKERPGRRPTRRASRDEGNVRVWRPVPPFAAPDPSDDAVAALPPEVPATKAAPHSSGQGIRFGDASWDEENDLEEYMHDDDVPSAPVAAAADPDADADPDAKTKPRKRRRKRAISASDDDS